MRVILINPPLDSVLRDGHVDPVTSYLFYNSAPLGLLYIAAVLEQQLRHRQASLAGCGHQSRAAVMVDQARVGAVVEEQRGDGVVAF